MFAARDIADAQSARDALATRVDGETLRIVGRLQRDTLVALWPTLSACRVAAIDLSAVTALDTAGLASLVCLAERLRASTGLTPRVLNPPAAYAALCAAYRIRPELEEAPR